MTAGLRDKYVRIEERSFSSEHKWMAVYVERRDHIVSTVGPCKYSRIL